MIRSARIDMGTGTSTFMGKGGTQRTVKVVSAAASRTRMPRLRRKVFCSILLHPRYPGHVSIRCCLPGCDKIEGDANNDVMMGETLAGKIGHGRALAKGGMGY